MPSESASNPVRLHLFMTGLSHKTAPIELREKLALTPDHEAALLAKVQAEGSPLRECLLISTCNRVEIYAVANDESAMEWTRRALAEASAVTGIEKALVTRCGIDAVRHLFNVAAGLESMVIGEYEIMGQLKTAYQSAQEKGLTGKVTNVLLQKAMNAGKLVRSKTALSQGQMSVASMAAYLAARIFEDLAATHAMILGAGETAELVGRSLLERGTKSISIANRTLERAVALAEKLKGTPFSLDQAPERLSCVDIVISSTGSPDPVIRRSMVEQAMQQRRGRPLFFIDIAVPRDIEPSVSDVENVYLYNIDDLQGLVDKNREQRMREVEKALALTGERSDEFEPWLEATLEGRQASMKHS